MEKRYIAENDVKLEFPKIPEYKQSILEGKKLEIKEESYKQKEFTNGAVFTVFESLLTLKNGEKFEGDLSGNEKNKDKKDKKENKYGLKKGKYTWPNNQIYQGNFDEQNRFFTPEGEVSKLIFEKGDEFIGEFKEGQICDGTFKSEGKEIIADFTGGKINGGYVDYKDTIKGIKFNGFLFNGKKEGLCKTEFKIKDKTYSIKGEYSEGLKDGVFIIREVSPNKDNLYIKGKYKQGERNGYFDIIDKEKGINTTHQYISFLQTKLINEYNKKYKENINGKEVTISITCRNNPINQLKDLISIRFSYLLTLDLTRANIDSISFLDNDESTLFSLQNLILSYNNISDIEPLINVDYKKLKTLIVNDNKIKDINCVEYFNFNELEELNLSNNPIESIEGIEKWKFPNLFNLSFNRTKINNIKPIYKANFPNLTQLDLYFTKIKNQDDLIPEKFEKCKNLKNIVFDRHF